jgi:flotillin
MKSVPPLNELFDMAGLNLPEYLAKRKENHVQEVEASECEE